MHPLEQGPREKGMTRTLKTIFVLGLAATIAIGMLHSGGRLIDHLPDALRRFGRIHDQRVPENVTCVVYERPPRTGSSTVGESLRSCLRAKGYDIGNGPWMKYHKVIPFMLSLPSTKKAIVTRHFVLPYWQLRELLGRCNNTFWISSTRRMKERLMSKAKFDVRGKHGSSILKREEEALVLQNLVGRDTKEAEELYERYPYVDDEKTLKVIPDYVVRSECFDQDLGLLLKALDCRSEVIGRNVHALNGSTGDKMMEGIELRLGDRRHKMMSFLAGEVNERGLEMATLF